MEKLIIIFVLSIAYLHANVKGINVSELEKLIHVGIKVIDVRTPEELKKTGIIPTSYRLNFYKKDGKINKDKWLNAFIRLVKNRQIKFVLISTDGTQAELGANLLFKTKGYKNPYYLNGGINAWIHNEKKLIKIKNSLK